MSWYKNGSKYTEKQLRKDCLPTLLPSKLRDEHWEEMGAKKLASQERPVYNPETHNAYSEVKDVKGVPTKVWTVEARPKEEIEAKQAAQSEQAALSEDAEVIKSNAALKALLKARPAQIETYIENNVTNLAEAKEVMTVLAKAVSLLMQSHLR